MAEETPPEDSAEPVDTELLAAESMATAEQIEQVLRWVIEGKSHDDIVHSIREFWPEASVEELSLAVTARLMEASQFTPEVVRGLCIEATREVYRKALELSELTVALRSIRQLWEMTSTTKI